MVLLRHLLGDVLRRLRQRQGRTLREVSAAARVSLGYLSEVERGQKEASSELLAAICTALNTPLSHVLGEVSDSFALAELQNEAELQSEPVLTPAPAGASRAAQRASLASTGRELQLPVSRAFSVKERLRVPAGHARGMDSEPVITPVGINEDHPAFDEVTRRVRDLGDMVPV
jgi:transcriptional regulator with XRE-family HTH domain